MMATPDHMTTDSSSGAHAPLLVWDCGSALYDSYELTAFTRQLDACGRSLSMPHLSDGTTPPPADDVVRHHQQRPACRNRRLRSLLRRLFSTVVRLRLFPASATARGAARYRTADCGGGSPWSGSGALTSIPEEEQSGSGRSTPEKGSFPVEMEPGPSALRKSQSERFIGSKTASSMVQFDVVL